MAYVITCDCGYVSRGETEDELVEEVNRHIDEVHPDLAGKVSRDDLVAMAEETLTAADIGAPSRRRDLSCDRDRWACSRPYPRTGPRTMPVYGPFSSGCDRWL